MDLDLSRLGDEPREPVPPYPAARPDPGIAIYGAAPARPRGRARRGVLVGLGLVVAFALGALLGAAARGGSGPRSTVSVERDLEVVTVTETAATATSTVVLTRTG